MASQYIDLPLSGGVASINGLTGDIILAAGSGISITPAGNTLTIAATGTYVTTVGTIDSNTSANGLFITGSTINTQTATASLPGMVSTTAQTFAGVKTFNSNPIMNALTASLPVVTDGSKALASISYASFAGNLDHNSLANLTVGDPHTQYLFLAGRSGGQTATGGTAASNNLTLRSTTNGTKGAVVLDETTAATSATAGGALRVSGGIACNGVSYFGATTNTAALAPITSATYDIGASTSSRYKEIWAQYLNAAALSNSGTATRSANASLVGAAVGPNASIISGFSPIGNADFCFAAGGAYVLNDVAMTTGYSKIQATQDGALAFGSTSNYSQLGTERAEVTASGLGAFAHGYSQTQGVDPCDGFIQILSSGNGSFAQGGMNGFYFGSPASLTAKIISSGQGSFAQGGGQLTTGDGLIQATNFGSFAQGSIANSGGTVSSTGTGSFAQGRVAGAGTIVASGSGAHASGSSASGFAITASGTGSFAFGSASSAITASATNSFQAFPGVNAQSLSAQFGILGSGIRLLASTTAPTTPTNGDIRQNSGGYVKIFSGGFERLIGHLYVAKTANYTATSDDYTIDCTSGTFNVTMPTASGITGKVYFVKNSGTGTITVNTTSSQTIDGVLTLTLTQYQCVKVQSNGSNWIILSRY